VLCIELSRRRVHGGEKCECDEGVAHLETLRLRGASRKGLGTAEGRRWPQRTATTKGGRRLTQMNADNFLCDGNLHER
jgi:hypothetical protein